MINKIDSTFKSLYFFIRQIYLYIHELIFTKKPTDSKNIPIIINNYNRYTFLKELIESLETREYRNIYIIDNNSTYLPLLDYYAQIPYKVFKLNKNLGYLALWKSNIYKLFKNQYFVYTDSDIVLSKECPKDFLNYFLSLMSVYPRASKIGCALSIKDLPDHYKNKNKVIEWESKFWKKEIKKNIYKAPIDTTFALYRPNVKGPAYNHDFNIRVGGEYTAKHLPWYNDDNNLSDEELFYISQSSTSTHWTEESKNK